MQIEILFFKDIAKARGLTVVIDVFRAFTTACYAIANGAEKIIPVRNIKSAYDIKKKNPAYILMGERGGVMQSGFDYGNSPFMISRVDFAGKTVVMTTSHGTQALLGAKAADEVITGSFVNAGAIIGYIKNKNTGFVSLVCTDRADEHVQDEDWQCASYIKNELEGKENDFAKIIKYLHDNNFTDYFFDPLRASHPKEDFEYSMVLNKFDFILRLKKENELNYLVKEKSHPSFNG